jgi:hypothetical protein
MPRHFFGLTVGGIRGLFNECGGIEYCKVAVDERNNAWQAASFIKNYFNQIGPVSYLWSGT